MPCDRMLKKGQTIQQRATEVRKAVDKIGAGLAAGRVKAVVGPQGAIAFSGVTVDDRDGVTDNCLYRRLMASGSPLAKMAIARAEALAGRSVNRQVVAHGAHSHDGGITFHDHKG